MSYCPACPVPGGACRGLVHPRDCFHVAAGVPGYAAMMRDLARRSGQLPASGPTFEQPPYTSPDAFLAPLRVATNGLPVTPADRPWEGRQARKPWEYRITAAIVHLDSPGLLRAVLAQLRAQTERPYLMVVDAGSLAVHRAELEAMEREADDLEVHYLRPRAWRFTSQPVAVGMDLAFAACQSPYLYATHTDVFLKRPDYLAWLLARCDAMTPVVGWQMSPRDWATDLWERIPSHTASLYHMPTMHRTRASWNMIGVASILGLGYAECTNGWPDTEVGLGLSLQAAGIGVRRPGDPTPTAGEAPSCLLLGPEPNEPYENDWLWHERSWTGQATYFPAAAAARRPRVLARAAEGVRLAAEWSRPDAEHLRILRLAETCPHRDRGLGCGCSGARCGPSGLRPDQVVTIADCMTCVGSRAAALTWPEKQVHL